MGSVEWNPQRGPWAGASKSSPRSWKLLSLQTPNGGANLRNFGYFRRENQLSISWFHCFCHILYSMLDLKKPTPALNIMIYRQKVGRLKPIWAVQHLKVRRLGPSHGDSFRVPTPMILNDDAFSTTANGVTYRRENNRATLWVRWGTGLFGVCLSASLIIVPLHVIRRCQWSVPTLQHRIASSRSKLIAHPVWAKTTRRDTYTECATKTRISQHSRECKDPRRQSFLWLVILIFDLLTPQINAFRDSSWNISVSSSVILAASFFRHRTKKNRQTHRKTEVETIYLRLLSA